MGGDITGSRLTPEGHLAVACRCGRPVFLPAHGQDTVTCRCRRTFIWDLDTIRVTRPRVDVEWEEDQR
jgi:hypothetical protein